MRITFGTDNDTLIYDEENENINKLNTTMIIYKWNSKVNLTTIDINKVTTEIILLI